MGIYAIKISIFIKLLNSNYVLLPLRNMKFYIFNTPGYTKVDWHTGKTILSRNGQHKGVDPETNSGQRRLAFAGAATKTFGTKGTASVNGVRMGVNAIKIASDPAIHQTFGGAERKEQVRQMKHAKTQEMLSGRANYSFRRGMGSGSEYDFYQ